ncbi:MAG: recombination regulator RecX [[Pasteurella] mairii]|uniref:Regulatory protein RecX n=1 Tax=[Pasteurella] mairii TaxID=757 RepID=A0A379B7S3_9PAST|nr:recombination regulator RecX [[Pasteurella] mairii]SUB34657.1 regulatory protein RecX [[Pasteurella] mairii]
MSSLALSYIVNLLSRREYSEFELRCKMQEKAFSEDEINQALSQAQQKHWQGDKRFTENYIHARAQRGYGFNRIQQELKQLKGIRAQVIDEIMAELEVDWSALARNTLRKKFPDYAKCKDPKAKQKIWRYMLSHGFCADDFKQYIGMPKEEAEWEI